MSPGTTVRNILCDPQPELLIQPSQEREVKVLYELNSFHHTNYVLFEESIFSITSSYRSYGCPIIYINTH